MVVVAVVLVVLLIVVVVLTRHALLGDLPVVDLLLQREVADEPINVTLLLLAVAVNAAHGLSVVTRVPRGVKHHHTIRPDQVHPQTARPDRDTRGYQTVVRLPRMHRCPAEVWRLPGGEQEEPGGGVGGVVELVDESLSL